MENSNVPQIHQKILPRVHIDRILDNASLTEAVCMVAPYGSGKTMSVIAWLRGRGRSALWMELDEADKDGASFIRHMSAVFAKFADNESAAFFSETDGSCSPGAFLSAAASRVMSRGISADTLVIDNFNVLYGTNHLRAVKGFIEAILGYMRVIILSLAPLPPVFNDAILKKRIILISMNELCFSPEEINAYFSINERHIRENELSRIYKETDGWPAALNVILAISRDGPADYSEEARSFVTDFFETEIWDGLDADVKDFLLKTSVLENVTPASCNAVTGVGATLPTLKWLFQNGMFISRQGKRDTFRYHRVFRDFLLDKLRTSAIDERMLYIKVGWWLYERGEYAQAFPFFFASRELFGLGQVLRILNPAEMGVEAFLELTGCITELNVRDLKAYPLIVSRMAITHYLKGNVDELKRLHDIFHEWTAPGALPISPDDYAECLWDAGWLSYLNPDISTVNDALAEHSNYKEHVPHLQPVHMHRFSVLRFPYALRGIRDYCATAHMLESFVNWDEKAGQHIIREETVLYEMELMRAEYAYENENFAKADKIVRAVMTEVADRRYTALYFVCMVLLCKLARAVYDPREIDVLTAKLETAIKDNGDLFLMPNFHAFEQRNRLYGGLRGFTEAFEKDNAGLADKPYFYLLYRHVALARGLMSLARYNEAIIVLDNLRMLCVKYKRTMDLIEINILRAVASNGLNNPDEACGFLSEALESAKTYGFIRVFSDEAADIKPILDMLQKKTPDKYIAKIAISCKKALVRSGVKTPGKRGALTKTELKILRGLQYGMSYKEIAVDNNIRVPTVKSHVHSIYSKLEVDNKTAAVIEAQNRGLLKPAARG